MISRDSAVLTAHAPVTPLGWLVFVELPVDRGLCAALCLDPALRRFDRCRTRSRDSGGRVSGPPDGGADSGAARRRRADRQRRARPADHRSTPATSWRRSATSSTAWPRSCRIPMRRWSARSRSARSSSNSPTSPNPGFLAAASHDLRQPLHALGLFVAQLRSPMSADECKPDHRAHRRGARGHERAVQRALGHFQARCRRARAQYHRISGRSSCSSESRRHSPDAAREKGLSLRVVPSKAWVRSDFILLERILFNLVSNAVRYTSRRRRRRRLPQARTECCGSRSGTPEPGFRRGAPPEHFRRVLSAWRTGPRPARWARPRARNRRPAVPPPRPADRTDLDRRQGLPLYRRGALGPGPRADRQPIGSRFDCACARPYRAAS